MINKIRITSMVAFKLKDKVIDQIALDCFNVARNEGSRFVAENKIKNIESSNEYINHQFKRLIKYAEKGEYDKFDFLAKILLKKSDVFLVYALNHVYPKWTSMCLTKVVRLLELVRKYGRDEISSIRYRRIWIDKKPGDYGRPLGVPNAEDRIYGHMITRIMEALFEGNKEYRDNQHGGRSRRGVLTFLKELSKKFESNKRIFEFDIKGYFDHIDHESMLNLVKDSKVLTRFLKGALTSKPESFKLPEGHRDPRDENEYWYQGEDWRNHITIGKKSLWINYATVSDFDLDNGWDKIQERSEELLYKYDAKLLYDPLKRAEWRILAPLDNGQYKLLIVQEDPPEMARNESWDIAKDLDLEGRGVPQGSSFGPVLASVLLGKIMPTNSELYMDDGIIYLGERRTSREVMIKRVNKLLKPIGCELNEDKSGILGTRKLVSQGLKIIGLRIKRNIFTDSTISSETRRGVMRNLVDFNADTCEMMLSEMLRKGKITVSKSRVLKWYVKKGRLEKIHSAGLELAEIIGLMGNLVARAFSPKSTIEEMKSVIEEGINRAEFNIRASKGSLGSRVLAHIGIFYLETTDEINKVVPDLWNHRAICNQVLLRYLKGERPIRVFREKGMLRPFNKRKSK